MPSRPSTWALALLTLVPAACAGRPPGPAPSAAARSDAALYAAIRESPMGRRNFEVSCTSQVEAQAEADRRLFGALLGVPPGLAGREFCARSAGAIASGRISLDDFLAVMSRSADRETAAKLIRILITEPGAGTQI